MMTLQLSVGKTYRARNGDVVRIVSEQKKRYALFFSDFGAFYEKDGTFAGDARRFDLVEEYQEITDPFDRVISALNDAERAEAEAMTRIRDSLAELRAALEAAQKEMRGEG